jgi:hypothetical protein
MRKPIVVVVMSLCVVVACSTRPSSSSDVEMFQVVVGTKTSLFEVVASNELRLAPGVKIEIVDGPGGKGSGMVLLRPNGEIGGYMACGCNCPSCENHCITVNDNPNHPSCGGGCTNSEPGLPGGGCAAFGPIIGPPKDPFRVRLIPKQTDKSPTPEKKRD